MNDLSTTTKINTDAIANLSTILSDQVIQTHDELFTPSTLRPTN